MAQESSSSSQSSVVMNQIATPEDLDLLRQDLRAKKQQLIGKNLSLSDGEPEKFWPVYHHYIDDLKQIGEEKFRLVKDYVEKWREMSDRHPLIYPSMARSRSKGPGTAIAIRAGGQPDCARQKGGDIFSIGPAHQHDDGAVVFAYSLSARQE